MPSSEIVTEEDIIRKRLLTDGEGCGDEKKVSNLIRMFVKWVKDPEQDDTTFQKMIAVIASCEMSVDKLAVVKKMNELEAKNYAKLHAEIEKEISSGKVRIEKYQKQLAQAKQIKSNKQQYNSISKIISQYPSREETTRSIAQIESEIEGLRGKKSRLEERVTKQKRQFEVLVYSIQQLQCELTDEPVSSQMDVDS